MRAIAFHREGRKLISGDYAGRVLIWSTDAAAPTADWLIEQGLADSAQFSLIQSEVESEMKKAVEFAVASPYPSVTEVEQDVYA